VIAAHNACIRELLQEVDGHGKAGRHMKLLTIETESSLGTLWDQEQCTQFCSKEELWEAAKEEEMRIPWKDEQEGAPVSEEQYQERFWRRRLSSSRWRPNVYGVSKLKERVIPHNIRHGTEQVCHPLPR
jgi:hypothetical protein